MLLLPFFLGEGFDGGLFIGLSGGEHRKIRMGKSPLGKVGLDPRSATLDVDALPLGHWGGHSGDNYKQ